MLYFLSGALRFSVALLYLIPDSAVLCGKCYILSWTVLYNLARAWYILSYPILSGYWPVGLAHGISYLILSYPDSGQYVWHVVYLILSYLIRIVASICGPCYILSYPILSYPDSGQYMWPMVYLILSYLIRIVASMFGPCAPQSLRVLIALPVHRLSRVRSLMSSLNIGQFTGITRNTNKY